MILTYNEHHSCTYFLKNTEGRSDFFMGRKEDREEHEDDRIEQTGQLTLENEQDEHHSCTYFLKNTEGRSDFFMGRKEDREEHEDDRIEQTGQLTLENEQESGAIHLLTVIGEVEGHDNLSNSSKTTKYEHVLPQLAAIEDSSRIGGLLVPQLAAIEDSSRIGGLLVLLNTMGGDVEAGLAIAEMIASLSKPTVSLVLGGSHSIGVPIAVSTDYSFIVPTGTMVIHPVRMNGTVIGAPQTFDYFKQMNGTVIGAPQTFDYFKQIQDRITGFVCGHCNITQSRMEALMMNQGMLTKDLGTILVGREAVREGIISEVGGISDAMKKLHQLIGQKASVQKKKNSDSDKKRIK